MAAAEESNLTTGGATEAQAKDDVKDDGSMVDEIFGKAPQNRVNVAANNENNNRRNNSSLQFYLARARKILRLEEECTVGGLGQAIGLVVEVVEILKREKVAEVKKVESSMVDGTNLRQRYRKPKIEITLGRGEYAELVSDYRRRKVTDIFETHDPDLSGKLTVETVKDMDLAKAFHSDEERMRDGEEFLHGKTQLDLPDFIRYASKLINPLLLEPKFQEAIRGLTGKEEHDAPHVDTDA
jgi:hypothetical protein